MYGLIFFHYIYLISSNKRRLLLLIWKNLVTVVETGRHLFQSKMSVLPLLMMNILLFSNFN